MESSFAKDQTFWKKLVDKAFDHSQAEKATAENLAYVLELFSHNIRVIFSPPDVEIAVKDYLELFGIDASDPKSVLGGFKVAMAPLMVLHPHCKVPVMTHCTGSEEEMKMVSRLDGSFANIYQLNAELHKRGLEDLMWKLFFFVFKVFLFVIAIINLKNISPYLLSWMLIFSY